MLPSWSRRRRVSKWTKNDLASFDCRAVSAQGLTCRFIDNNDEIYVVELSDESGRDLTSQFCSKSTSGERRRGRRKKKKKAVKAYVHECGLKEDDVVQLEVVYVAQLGSTVFNCHVVG